MTVFHWGKAVLTGLLVLALSGSLTACSVGAKQQAVYDDDAQIAEQGDSYSFAKRTGTLSEDELSLEYRRFYGVQTVWTFESDSSEEVQIEYDAVVEKGKFKVVMVTSDQVVRVLLEQCGQGTVELAVPAGKSAVKIVGHRASGRICLSLDGGMGEAPIHEE